MKLPECELTTVKSGVPVIVVTSLATLFAEFVSPPPETVAVFVRLSAAFGASVTVRVIAGKLAAEAIASARVHVSVATVQVQPLPAIAVAVRPGGNVSTTVTVPLEVTLPLFNTVMV